MHTIIGLFNHKGGVSKTTTTFHLGWMLAEKGYKVLMVDADPQCNLTGMVLGYDSEDAFDEYYEKYPEQNIYSALKPAFESQPKEIQTIECLQVEGREGLVLLPGHINLSEYEVTLGIAQELSGSIQALRNLPGAFYYLISKVAVAESADYVLIDMNPGLGAINQNLLMISDRFLVPVSPDYFSVMAIDSLHAILPKWAEWAKKASQLENLRIAAYPFPEPRLKFLGTVIQKFRPRKGQATVGFKAWIDRVNQKVVNNLLPSLQKHNLALSPARYEKVGLITDSYSLAQIPDFNTLIAISQEHRRPVFALEDSMFGYAGAVLEQNKEKIQEFKILYDQLAERVITLSADE
jgi:cellulose biosynthesis protein BcsQ